MRRQTPIGSSPVQVQEGLLILRAKMQQQDEATQGAAQQSLQSQGSQATTGLKQNAQPQSQAGNEQSNQPSRRYHQRERRFGYFERIMSLPANVDEERIQAEFKEGVLTLHLPKQEQAQQGRRIPIQNSPQTNAPQTPSQPQINQNAGSSQQASQTAGAKTNS